MENHEETTTPTPMTTKVSTAAKKALLILSCILLAIGNCGGPLITRLYFIHGGNRVWLSSSLETAGWPFFLVVHLILYFHRLRAAGKDGNNKHATKFIYMRPRLFFAVAFIGVLTGLDDYLYAYGVARLPISTSALILAPHLAFVAVFAYLLVKQKFTPYSINAVVLLTVGAGVLALHTSSDRPERERVTDKVIPREATDFELGPTKYYTILCLSALLWQCFFMGAIGVIFCASSLLSGIIIAALLPVTEILAVVFYKEKFQAEKGVALVLSLWGFASYFYGEYNFTKKAKDSTESSQQSMELTQANGSSIILVNMTMILLKHLLDSPIEKHDTSYLVRLSSLSYGTTSQMVEQKSIKPPARPCRQTLPLAKFTAGATTPPPTPAVKSSRWHTAGLFTVHTVQLQMRITRSSSLLRTKYTNMKKIPVNIEDDDDFIDENLDRYLIDNNESILYGYFEINIYGSSKKTTITGTTVSPMEKANPAAKKNLLILHCILLSIGNCSGPLVMRLYFIHGGQRIWLIGFIETVGWPLIFIILIILYFNRRFTGRNNGNNHPITFIYMRWRLFMAVALIGVLTGLDDYLYSYGIAHLPVSTYALINASRLVFMAVFAFILVKQKFTLYSINAVVLLTVGSAVLAFHSSGDRPKGESKGEYVMGFLMTVAAAALYGLVSPLVELTYKKAKQEITYTLVLEVQMVMCLFATVFCMVGMIFNDDFKKGHRLGRNENKQTNSGNEKLNNVKGITTPRNPITVPKITPIFHPFIHNGEDVVCHLSCGTANIIENSIIPHPPKTPNVAIDDS
ncbi:hypothetical protein LXL04_031139 [Taraxacum kok-saghyz]